MPSARNSARSSRASSSWRRDRRTGARPEPVIGAGERHQPGRHRPACAAVVGKPRMRRATAQEATRATGFVIGGIPPFGHRQRIAWSWIRTSALPGGVGRGRHRQRGLRDRAGRRCACSPDAPVARHRPPGESRLAQRSTDERGRGSTPVPRSSTPAAWRRATAGAAAAGRRGVRPLRGRRRPRPTTADLQGPTPTGCAAPSCASRARWRLDGALRVARLRRAAGRPLGHGRPAPGQVRLRALRAGQPHGRAALDAPVRDAPGGRPVLAAARHVLVQSEIETVALAPR